MEVGVYTWIYEKGSFEVELRVYKNVFFCASYSVGGSTWTIEPRLEDGVASRLVVDWKKFGQYEFMITGDKLLNGNVSMFVMINL